MALALRFEGAYQLSRRPRLAYGFPLAPMILGVVLGAGAKAAAGDAAKYGLDGVLCSEDGALENYLTVCIYVAEHRSCNRVPK